jgi:hypothetical protein
MESSGECLMRRPERSRTLNLDFTLNAGAPLRMRSERVRTGISRYCGDEVRAEGYLQ